MLAPTEIKNRREQKTFERFNVRFQFMPARASPLHRSAIAQSFSPMFDSRFLESESRI